MLTNKYAEGYPGKRYYGGCQFVDVAESLAIERAKKLFNCGFANVQPNSGSQANQGVFNALAKPGDTILGLSLARRRPSDARLARQPVGQVVQGRALHGASGHATASTWTRCASSRTSTSRASSSPAARPIRASSISPPSAPSPTRSARTLMVDMAHFAGLVAGGAASRARSRMPTSSPRRRTRPCAARAAA